jgi:hypothetical protein
LPFSLQVNNLIHRGSFIVCSQIRAPFPGAVTDRCWPEQVKDRVFIGPNIRFGEVTIPAAALVTGERLVGGGQPLVKKYHENFQNGTLDFEVHLTTIDLTSAERLPPVVPHCYFAAHTDCRVTLYQDAHQEPGSVAAVPVVTCADMPPPQALAHCASFESWCQSLVASDAATGAGGSETSSMMLYESESVSSSESVAPLLEILQAQEVLGRGREPRDAAPNHNRLEGHELDAAVMMMQTSEQEGGAATDAGGGREPPLVREHAHPVPHGSAQIAALSASNISSRTIRSTTWGVSPPSCSGMGEHPSSLGSSPRLGLLTHIRNNATLPSGLKFWTRRSVDALTLAASRLPLPFADPPGSPPGPAMTSSQHGDALQPPGVLNTFSRSPMVTRGSEVGQVGQVGGHHTSSSVMTSPSLAMDAQPWCRLKTHAERFKWSHHAWPSNAEGLSVSRDGESALADMGSLGYATPGPPRCRPPPPFPLPMNQTDAAVYEVRRTCVLHVCQVPKATCLRLFAQFSHLGHSFPDAKPTVATCQSN